MTDRPSRSLEDEIRTHLKDHEAFCEPHCECVDIRLLRAALDRIEGLTDNRDAWTILATNAQEELSHLRAENARFRKSGWLSGLERSSDGRTY